MKAATLFLISLPMMAISQVKAPKMPVSPETKQINYNAVMEVPGTKKNELYNRALAWCMEYYVNPGDVIRERDTVESKILCKARFKIFNEPNKDGVATDAGIVQYTMLLAFKEGKYRYEFTDIIWKQTSHYPIEKWMDTSDQYYRPAYAWYLQETDDHIKKVIKELDKGIKTVPVKGKKEW